MFFMCMDGGVVFRDAALQTLAVSTGYLSYCRLCLSLTGHFLYLGLFSVSPLDAMILRKSLSIGSSFEVLRPAALLVPTIMFNSLSITCIPSSFPF